jgi:hypothetical protein
MRKILALFVIIFFGMTGMVLGQSSKEAFKALKKDEARTETGVSYQDYPQIIADAKVDIDSFLAGKEAKKNPQFADHIKKAMDYYIIAGKIWNIQFAEAGMQIDTPGINNEYGQMIRRLYPKAKPERPPNRVAPV